MARPSAEVYTDRASYFFNNLGDYGAHCSYVQGANDDKDTPAATVQFTLGVDCPVTVYLDLWGHFMVRPFTLPARPYVELINYLAATTFDIVKYVEIN